MMNQRMKTMNEMSINMYGRLLHIYFPAVDRRGNMSWENYLHKIYYNPNNAGSFLGPDKLFRYVRKDGKYVICKYKIRKWLQNQEAYSLQRPLRRLFQRNKIMVTGIDDQWSADLMDMAKFAKYNNGFMYVLVVIDTLSKYLWMRPLKKKKRGYRRHCVRGHFQGG